MVPGSQRCREYSGDVTTKKIASAVRVASALLGLLAGTVVRSI
jgi:hypothetical protein